MSWQSYKGLQVRSAPSGDAGINLNNNFKSLADNLSDGSRCSSYFGVSFSGGSVHTNFLHSTIADLIYAGPNAWGYIGGYDDSIGIDIALVGTNWVLTLNNLDADTISTWTADQTFYPCPPAILSAWTRVLSGTGDTLASVSNSQAGSDGLSGYSGYSGFSGYSGAGLSGFSGKSGYSGTGVTSATPNTIAQRDASGDLYANIFWANNTFAAPGDLVLDSANGTLYFNAANAFQFENSSGQGVYTWNNTLDDGGGGLQCQYINVGNSIECPTLYADNNIILQGYEITTDGSSLYLNGVAIGGGGGGGSGFNLISVAGYTNLSSTMTDPLSQTGCIHFVAGTGITLATDTTAVSVTIGLNGSAITGLNASNISSGTIANARTTATDVATANTIVSRDASGNFGAKKFNAQQYVPASGRVALTDAATIAIDCSLSNIFTVTLGGNRTLGNPTKMIDGQTLIIEINQDATGSRTLSLGTAWNAGALSTTLTTTAGKIDVIHAYYNSTAAKWIIYNFPKGY
jgi:hypothetical protein